MSATFTPGPWRWWLCKDGSFKTSCDYAQITSGNVQVAKVQILSVTEEDLRLMAAAPELLAALQRAAVSAGFQYMMHETRDVISTAIAKATGAA